MRNVFQTFFFNLDHIHSMLAYVSKLDVYVKVWQDNVFKHAMTIVLLCMHCNLRLRIPTFFSSFSTHSSFLLLLLLLLLSTDNLHAPISVSKLSLPVLRNARLMLMNAPHDAALPTPHHHHYHHHHLLPVPLNVLFRDRSVPREFELSISAVLNGVLKRRHSLVWICAHRHG